MGDPVALTWTTTRIARAHASAERGCPLWIDDYRPLASAGGVAVVLRELGFADGRVGIIGIEAKGPGEMCANPVLPAVANAVFNAVGVRITDLPITPEKVLRGIKANGGALPQRRV